jgi:hypothetical protein
VIIQTVVQNALRRLRKQRMHPTTSTTHYSASAKAHEPTQDEDTAHWSRQEILPWLIAFAVGLAIVAALVVAFV